MIKVLVTGAAGSIGIHVVKYLLAEGKYEITLLDLKNKDVIKKLNRFRKRVNILYGDVNDEVLMNTLVKKQNYIIHLASILPPIADMKKDLSHEVDYKGCQNIVRAIKLNNPDCHLFYASTTSMYKNISNPSVKSRIKLNSDDYFSTSKLASEKLIKENLKNYTIFRIPLVLSNPLKEPFMYHGKNMEMDVITKEDVAYAFVKGLKYSDRLNNKTFNLAGYSPVNYKTLLNKLLEINGLSFKYIGSRIFLEKNYYSPVCVDRDELNDIIDYRSDSLNDYYNRQRGRAKKRKIRRLMVKPFIRR